MSTSNLKKHFHLVSLETFLYICAMISQSDQIIIRLLHIGNQLLKSGNRITAESGLNQQQFVVLNYIVSYQPVNQNQICSGLILEKSNISKIISKLERFGYIQIRGSLSDQRSMVIESTPKGKECVRRLTKTMHEYNERLLKDLSEEEAELVLGLLNRISARFVKPE